MLCYPWALIEADNNICHQGFVAASYSTAISYLAMLEAYDYTRALFATMAGTY